MGVLDEDIRISISVCQEKKEISQECRLFLHNLSTPFPSLLIDTDFLKTLHIGKCLDFATSRITVAISTEYQEKILEKDENSRIKYFIFKDEGTRDYIQFSTDPKRVVPKYFKTHQIGNFSIPENIPLFLDIWKRSVLSSCLGLYIPREQKTGHQFNHGKAAAKVLAELRDVFLMFKMFPFLNGGTLLGWYRECQFIPHTGDIDLAVFAEDFNPAIVDYFQSSMSPFRLLNDSFELTVQSKYGYSVSIDIFLMYRNKENNGTVTSHRWVGGMKGTGEKIKYIYPKYDPWCSADLHGHLFWVTCSPHKMIPFEYGPLWYQDVSSDNYSWAESARNVMPNGRWSREKMRDVYKIY